MHRRPSHMDVEATQAAWKAGVFKSRYSYFSTRRHPGTEIQCVYLAGKDCEHARDLVLAAAKGRCQYCGKWTLKLEAHHIAHKYKQERCWCPMNLIALCTQCHRGRNGIHVQVRWTERKAEAIEGFEKLYDNIV